MELLVTMVMKFPVRTPRGARCHLNAQTLVLMHVVSTTHTPMSPLGHLKTLIFAVQLRSAKIKSNDWIILGGHSQCLLPVSKLKTLRNHLLVLMYNVCPSMHHISYDFGNLTSFLQLPKVCVHRSATIISQDCLDVSVLGNKAIT